MVDREKKKKTKEDRDSVDNRGQLREREEDEEGDA